MGKARILIGYPPLSDPRGHHQTGQNRQAQVFVHGAYIYPCVPSSAATMLKEAGHEVMWADGEAEEKTWRDYLSSAVRFKPDILAWEVKTPSVKTTWERVRSAKTYLPNATFVLFGDHVTALPEETLEHSPTDVVLTGGDYDFGLLKLASNPLYRGVWKEPTTNSLDNLAIPDRSLTKWRLYGYEKGSGNYKYLPGTHTYFGRDCWWRKDGGCTFCSWTNTFKNFRVVDVQRAVDEVIECDRIGVREVFDDTGTFPIGKWMEEFCEKIIRWREKSRSKIRLGCNMRPGAINKEAYGLLGRAGFRFILYGLESANQGTLDRIQKGQRPGDMESTLSMAKRAGLEPHVTCMVGYPWESVEDARRTIKFTGELFKKGLIDTLQATICIPYPGTKLYQQCLENKWLKYPVGSWNKWDMRRPVMETGIQDKELLGITRGIYKSCITPKFVLRKVFSIRSMDDVKFLWRATKFMGGHLIDFKGKQ